MTFEAMPKLLKYTDESLSMTNRALLYAHSRGIHVRDDGEIIGIRGLRKKQLNTSGYYRITVSCGPLGVDRQPVRVHRLQAYQIYGDVIFEEGCQVRHLDSNSRNNKPDNIGIGTQSQNMFDRPAELRKEYALNAASFKRKLSNEQVAELRRKRKEGALLKHLVAEYGISKGNVSDIVNGKLYKEGYEDPKEDIG